MKNLLSGPSILIYILFGIIVFSFLYYAYAYVPEREKRLTEKGVRTLLNMEAGIEAKAENLSSFMGQRYETNYQKGDEDSLRNANLNKHLYNKLAIREVKKTDYFTADSLDITPSKKSTSVLLGGHIENKDLLGEIDIVDFMKGITTNEVFQCVTIIGDNKILYSDNSKILQAHALNGFYKPPVDSMGITIEKTVVNNKEYYQFTNRIRLAPTPVFIAGFIAVEDYERYTDEIPFIALFFLVLFTIFTFATFPLVKIFVISKWERLESNDYVFAGIGLVFSLYLLGAGIYAIHQWIALEDETSKKLKIWNEQIQINFREELDFLFKNLKSSDWSSQKNFIYHEMFSYSDSFIDQKELGFTRLQLPFEDKLVDSSRLAFYNNYSRIGDREYIKRMKDNTFAYYLKPKKDSTRTHQPDSSVFYIESVFSFSRATREAVISIPGDTLREIRAMSADLKTVMLYSPPIAYNYCIIDNDGKVVFSSRDSHNNLNNVFESFTGAGFIHQSIIGGTPGKGHFNYGRSGFQGYISPLQYIMLQDHSAPLFLLTYHDESHTEWQILATAIHSAGVSLALICMVFVLRIILGMIHYLRKSNRIFGQKKGFMSYIFPTMDSSTDYIFLNFLALVMIIIAVFLTYGETVYYSFWIWVVCIFIYLILQYILLTNPGKWFQIRRKSFDQKRSKKFMVNYCAFVVTWYIMVLIAPTCDFFSKSRGAVESSYNAMVIHETKVDNRKRTKKLHDQYSSYSQVSKSAKTFTHGQSEKFENLQSGANLNSLVVKVGNEDLIMSDGSKILRYTFDFLLPGFGINPSTAESKNTAKDLNGSIIWFIIISMGLIVLVVLKMFNTVPEIFRGSRVKLEEKLKHIEIKFTRAPLRVILVGVPGSKRSKCIKKMLEILPGIDQTIWKTIDLLSMNSPGEIEDVFKNMEHAHVLLIKNWMPQGIELPHNDRFVILRDIIYSAHSKNKHIFLYASQSISSLENYLTEIIDSDKSMAPQINNVREVMIRFMHQFQQITVPINKNIFALEDDSNPWDNTSTVYAKKQFFAPKYNSIWNSLSLPERFMLFDLAEDGLLNLTDKITLGMLYLKGLVIYNPTSGLMDCFDNGFALFIRQGISGKDLMHIEKNSKKLGRWQGVRLGLLLIAVSLVGFVFVINPNVIQGMIGVAGAIAALTASVGKISSNFKIPSLTGILGRNNQ